MARALAASAPLRWRNRELPGLEHCPRCRGSALQPGRAGRTLAGLASRIPVSSLLALLACLGGSAGTAAGLTEQEALRLLRDSPYYRELQARVEVVRAVNQRETLYPSPTASMAVEGAGRTEFYVVEQPLAINGRRNLLRKAGELSAVAEEARAEHQLHQIEAALREAFYRLAFEQRREGAIRGAIGEMEGVGRLLREREDAGEGSRLDRLWAEQRVAELRIERARAEAAIAESQARLASYLPDGTDPAGLVARGALEPTHPLPDLQDAVAQALLARADVRVEKGRLEELAVRERAAQRLRVPEPVVSGGLKRADIGMRVASGPVVSVAVGIPVFGKSDAERKIVQAEAAAARARSETIERQILAEVRAAHSSLRIRRAIAETHRAEALRPAEEIRRIADVAYGEGEAGILELVEAYRVLHSAELRLVDLEQDAKLAEVRFDLVVARDLLP